MTLDNLTALAARDDLLHVVRRWPELRANLARGGGKALTGLASGGSDRIPLDLGISDLLREIEDSARFYGQVLLEEVPPAHGCGGACHGSPEHSCGGHLCATDGEPVVAAQGCPSRQEPITTSAMPGLLREVAARYGHFTMANDRIGLDFADFAHEAARSVDGALGDRERPEYLGPCPNPDHDGAGCPGELFLSQAKDAGTCGVCGQEFTRATQGEYIARVLDGRIMTLMELRGALLKVDTPVPYRTLQTWARREKLLEHAEWDLWPGIPWAVAPTGLYPFAAAHQLAKARPSNMTRQMEGSAA